MPGSADARVRGRRTVTRGELSARPEDTLEDFRGFDLFEELTADLEIGAPRLGLGGLLDPATEFGLERQPEDFGQTLGRWGFASGPFLVLPIFVSLEKIDRRLFDAAADLYSPFAATFRKVILPLSLPGVFAGTLLVFIPATGDFINAHFLGSPSTSMIWPSLKIATVMTSPALPENAALELAERAVRDAGGRDLSEEGLVEFRLLLLQRPLLHGTINLA